MSDWEPEDYVIFGVFVVLPALSIVCGTIYAIVTYIWK